MGSPNKSESRRPSEAAANPHEISRRPHLSNAECGACAELRWRRRPRARGGGDGGGGARPRRRQHRAQGRCEGGLPASGGEEMGGARDSRPQLYRVARAARRYEGERKTRWVRALQTYTVRAEWVRCGVAALAVGSLAGRPGWGEAMATPPPGGGARGTLCGSAPILALYCRRDATAL